MDTRVRAKLLIPVMVFLAIAIPAIIIPIHLFSEANPSPVSPNNPDLIDPLGLEDEWNPGDRERQVDENEVHRYLDHYLNE